MHARNTNKSLGFDEELPANDGLNEPPSEAAKVHAGRQGSIKSIQVGLPTSVEIAAQEYARSCTSQP